MRVGVFRAIVARSGATCRGPRAASPSLRSHDGHDNASGVPTIVETHLDGGHAGSVIEQIGPDRFDAWSSGDCDCGQAPAGPLRFELVSLFVVVGQEGQDEADKHDRVEGPRFDELS